MPSALKRPAGFARSTELAAPPVGAPEPPPAMLTMV